MSKTKRWAILATTVIAIAVVARWLHWNQLRPPIAWVTEHFGGIRVDIKGDLDLFTHWEQTIRADEVSLTDLRDGVKREPFLQVDRISTTIDLKALLGRDIRLTEILIGTIRLDPFRFGDAAPSDAQKEEGKVESEKGWHLGWTRFEVPRFLLLKKDLTIAELSGSLAGQVTTVPFEVTGRAEIAGEYLARTLSALGYQMSGDVARYSVAADVHLTGDQLDLRDTTLRVGGSQATGSTLSLGFDPLTVTTFLHFKELRFADLGVFLPRSVQSELPSTRLTEDRPSLYSGEPIATAWMNGPPLEIRAKVDHFLGDDKASLVDAFDLNVLVKDGKAKFEIPRASLLGGKAEAELALTRREGGLTARLTGNAHDLRTGRLFQEFLASAKWKHRKFGNLSTDQLIDGKLEAFLDVTGNGESLRSIMATLNGRAGVYVGEGKVSSLLVELLGLDLTEAVGVLLAKKQTVSLACLVIGAQAADGILTFDPGFISTGDSDIVAKGELDLADEEVRLELRTYPKDPSLGALRTAIKVSGQLVDPRVHLETKDLAARIALGVALGLLSPAASLLATIEPGNAPDRRCSTYLGRLRAH